MWWAELRPVLVPRKVNGWAVEWSDDDSDAHDALRWDEHLRVFSPRWTTRFVVLALQAQQAAPPGGHIKLRLCWRRPKPDGTGPAV